MTDRPESEPAYRILACPGEAGAVSEHLRTLRDDGPVLRWFRRLLILPGAYLGGSVLAVDGDVLNRAVRAAGTLDRATIRRQVNAASPADRVLPPFFAAALLSSGRLDPDKLSALSVTYADGRDRFDRLLNTMAGSVAAQTNREVHEILAVRTLTGLMLRDAGYPGLAARFGRSTSLLACRYQKALYGDGQRVFSAMWTVAIGHLAVLAFLIKGRRHGYQGVEGTRICGGPVANRFLLEQVMGLNGNVELVDPRRVVGDHHTVIHCEWVDGRLVDYFEACGLIADAEGDAQGGILERPSRNDVRLAACLAAAGIDGAAPIVTLHCREPGFRPGSAHDLRNVDVTTYLPAIAALVGRGYRVVRLGDPSMTPLPPMAGVYDYARSPLKSPELDVLLPAAARFHVGCSSGLSLVPLLFGTPTLFLNWHPVTPLPWGRRNRTVLRPLRAIGGLRVTDRAVYGRAGRLTNSALLRAAGWESEGLTAAEVLDAVTGFADTVESPGQDMPRSERNRGDVWMAGDDGRFIDFCP